MPNATAAEWLIARFTDRSRASSIVGDLLEVTAKTGGVRFWLSVVGVVLSLIWRSIVASAGALLSLYLLHALAMPPVPNVFLAHRPPDTWIPMLFLLAVIVESLWMAVPYAVIRYGLHDRFSQVTLALCAPFTLILFFWFVPAILFPGLGIAGPESDPRTHHRYNPRIPGIPSNDLSVRELSGIGCAFGHAHGPCPRFTPIFCGPYIHRGLFLGTSSPAAV